MNEMIRVKNTSFDRYKELLMRRDAVRKEAFECDRAYVREFGDLILEIFRLKMECIRKKKTIEYCQAAANRGMSVDPAQLQEYLREELISFQNQLEAMIEDTKHAKACQQITATDLLKIKKIYHRMVKKIHPDMNPLVAENDQLQELWQRVVTAYTCNDLKELQEAEILVNKVLEELGAGAVDVDIQNIDEKIAELEMEIKKIRETDPYMYKFLLADEHAVREKVDSLNEEKKAYEDYASQLDDILTGLMGSGVSFTWRMN